MKRRKIIGFIVIALFFMILGRNLSFLPQFDLNKPTSEELRNDVQAYISKQPGLYGVYFKDLKTGSSFSISADQTFTAASVNKVPVVAAAYYLDGIGKLSLDDKVTILEKDIQDYGTGSIRYSKPGDTYSLRNLARLSLQQSDNTAAHVLALKIGTPKIQKIIDSWGLSQTDMKNNKSSPQDMSILFEKIYKGEITNSSETKELLEFLTKSDFEERLPGKLPKTVKIYHKTGDGEGFVHDVGLIESGERAYFLGVMTSDIGNNEEKTKKSIAEISKIVFDR